MKKTDNHISNSRKKDSQKIIKNKLAVLESYVADGVPENAFVPKSEAQFRLWEDSQIGLEKIGSPNTLNKPHNKPYKEKALELIQELLKRKNRKEKKRNLVDSLRAEIKEKNQLIEDLTGQWHFISYELERLQKKYKHEIKRKDERIAELTKEIRKVTPLMKIDYVNQE